MIGLIYTILLAFGYWVIVGARHEMHMKPEWWDIPAVWVLSFSSEKMVPIVIIFAAILSWAALVGAWLGMMYAADAVKHRWLRRGYPR